MNSRLLVIAASLLLAVACSKKPEEPVSPMPVNKTLVVTAGPNINQYNDSAHPVVIRLYQLKSRTEFEAASFWDIFEGKSETLAGVVIDNQSLSPLYPSENRLVAIDLNKDTFFLGVFAEFADYEPQTFTATAPISEELLDAGVTVSVTSSGVSIAYRDEAAEFEVAEEPKGSGSGGFLGKLIGVGG